MKARVFSILLRVLALTWRYELSGHPPRGHAVVAFWHSSMVAVWKYFAFHHATGVTSLSKDGDLLAQLLHDWKYSVIRGSSSRGGAEVLDTMIEEAKKTMVLITPDGPRGPAHKAKPGAVIAAQRAGVPLVFCSVSISHPFVFHKSWDRFQLPLPFARIRLHFHEARTFSHDASRDDLQQTIESLHAMD